MRILDSLDAYKIRWDSILAAIDDKSAFKDNIDSTNLVQWIWNTPQLNHITAGTFGDYLDADISGLGSGSGAYAYSLLVLDTANNQPVENISVTIRNLLQTSLIAGGATNANGLAVFNLNADSYLAIPAGAGYLFDQSDTIVVSASSVDTLRGYPFDPGQPFTPGLCRVFGFLYNVSGLAESGATITALLPKGVVQHNSTIISPFKVSTLSDTTGYFYLDLIPSDSLVPVGELYEFSINRSDGSILRKRLRVPDSSSWQLTW